MIIVHQNMEKSSVFSIIHTLLTILKGEVFMQRLTLLFSGVLMPALLLAGGVFFTVTLGRFFLLRPKRVLAGVSQAAKEGGASPWRTLSVALAGTLGVGNITGVALAIYYGGPGAVFWMWVSAFFAMFLKYAEIVLALRTRVTGADGEVHGGAMYYMKTLVTGKTGRFFAGMFAVLCMMASLTLGGVVQTSAAAEAAESVFGVPKIVVGAVFAVLAAMILFKGIRRVEAVTSALIPLLCAAYTLLSLVAIALRFEALPGVFGAIFRGAFSLRSGAAGIAGFLSAGAFRYGVARGLVSNEAGCGTSPIVHAGSKVREPAAQGIFGILEVFVDTVLLCTLTALVILTSAVPSCEGSAYVIRAYGSVLGGAAAPFLALSIALFAFATVLCWAHYGRECLSYFTNNGKARTAFLALTALSVFLGAVISPALLWDVTDLVLALMTVLNLSALFLGYRVVREETERFFAAPARAAKRKDRAGILRRGL